MYDMFLALLESDRLVTILDFVVKIITIISGVVLAYLTLLQLKVRSGIDTVVNKAGDAADQAVNAATTIQGVANDVAAGREKRDAQLEEISSTTKATNLAVNGHKQELERQIAVLHAGYVEAGLKAPEDATPRPPHA